MPFLAQVKIHTAGSNLVRGTGESSKIVPSLTENWNLQLLHLNLRMDFRYVGSKSPHLGQNTQPDHRLAIICRSQASRSA